MRKDDHVIQRVTFDVTTGSSPPAEVLQDRISAVFRLRLEDVVQRCLNEAAMGDRRMAIDHLVVDLGEIPEDVLEIELERRLSRALREALAHLRWPANGTTDDGAARKKAVSYRPLDLLRAYLLHGYYPWQAGADAPPPAALMAASMESHPAETRALLAELGVRANVRERLAMALGEGDCHRLLRWMMPSEAFRSSFDALARVLSSVPWSVLPPRDVPLFLFEEALAFLSGRSPEHITTAAFTRHLMSMLARRQGVPLEDVLDVAIAGLPEDNDARDELSTFYGEVFRDKGVEEVRGTGEHVSAAERWGRDDGEDSDEDVVEDVRRFLLGRPPLRATGGVDRRFVAALGRLPGRIAALVRDHGRKPEVRRRLAHGLSAASLGRLVTVIEPADAGYIVGYAEELQAAHRHTPVVQDDARGFERSVWSFVLAYLLSEQGSMFDLRMFVRSTVRQMAAHYNVAYRQLLAFLAARLKEAPASAPQAHRLRLIMHALMEDDEGGTTAFRRPSTFAHAAPEAAAMLERFLREGVRPEAWAGASMRSLASWLRRIDDRALGRMLRRVGARSEAVDRIAVQLPPSFFARAVRLLAEADAPAVLAVTRGLGLARKGGAPIDMPAAAFRVQLRRDVLGYLLARPGGVVLSGLVGSTLRRQAARAGVAYRRLLAAARRRGAGQVPALHDAIERLQRDEAAHEGRSLSEAGILPSFRADHAGLDLVVYFVRHGAVPSWGVASSAASLGVLLRRLYEARPDDVVAALADATATSAGAALRLRLLLGVLPDVGTGPEDRGAYRRLAALLESTATAGAPPSDGAPGDGKFGEAPAETSGGGAARDDEAPVGTGRSARLPDVDPGTGSGGHVDALTSIGRVDALLFYLAHGAVPWWGRWLVDEPVERWLEDVLDRQGSVLARRLADLPARRPALTRLAGILPSAQRRRLVDTLAPGFGGFVETMRMAMVAFVADVAAQAVGYDRPTRVWEAILGALLDARGAAIEPTALLTASMRRLANDVGVPYGTVVTALAGIAAARAPAAGRYAPLAETLDRVIEAASLKEEAWMQEARGGKGGREVTGAAAATRAVTRAPRSEDEGRAADDETPTAAEIGDDARARRDDADRTSPGQHARTATGGRSGMPGSDAAGGERLHDARHGDTRSASAGPPAHPPGPMESGAQAEDERRGVERAADTRSDEGAPQSPSGDRTRAIPPPPKASTGEDTAEAHAPADRSPSGRKDEDSYPISLFLHLLRHAMLPEGLKVEGRAVDTPEALERYLREAIARSPERWRRVLSGVLARPIERLRLVAFFSFGFVETLIRASLPDEEGTTLVDLAAFRKIAAPLLRDDRDERTRDVVLEVVLGLMAQDLSLQGGRLAFLRALLEEMAVALHRPVVEVAGQFVEAAMKAGLSREILDALRRLEWEAEVAGQRVARVASTGGKRRAHRPGEPDTLMAGEAGARRVDEASDEMPPDEPAYVSNAGIILLWPFLQRFFEMLELASDGAFVDAAAAGRAIHLLQYLAGAGLDAPEYELVLNKVLCGVRIARPIRRAASLTERERAVGDELLFSVTQRWTKLQNTSVVGLQEAFLRRPGRLLRKEQHWSLTVERRAYDVLLDSLPWSILTIRLPWMELPLLTQWR